MRLHLLARNSVLISRVAACSCVVIHRAAGACCLVNLRYEPLWACIALLHWKCGRCMAQHNRMHEAAQIQLHVAAELAAQYSCTKHHSPAA